ncbi:monocarboxylate transporter, putative [Ixodes scapularis]|uniref:Monocarboxylate transporter, putative n=1 Tax=Ixodes scapularis TaxID=6945 RepID=B7QA41_IXOSC|nr:monocarboxylate transporter, putative [Ixodes scapularis]|eukprot:XP_002399964.1 monocarboxylate transporter, putative [Ixodes scapularis]
MPHQNPEVARVSERKKIGLDTCWHVILLITAISFVGMAIFRTAGYQYVAFMNEFGVDRESASWPQSLMTGLSGMTGLFVAALQKKFSITSITIAGSVLAWLGAMTSVCAKSMIVVTLTLGVIHSVGVGIIFVLLQVFIVMYFDQLGPTALGLSAVGMTASAFVFTKLLELLDEEYGLRNAFLIVGAILLHLSPLTYLLKIPPWYKRKKTDQVAHSEPSENSANVSEADAQSHDHAIVETADRVVTTYRRDILILLRTPPFYVIVLSAAATTFIDSILLTTMLDFAVDKGSTHAQAVWLTSFQALTDIVGRLCLPVLADLIKLPRRYLLTLNQILMGITLLIAPFVSSLWQVVVICLLISVFIGCGVIMHDVLVPDYIELERLLLVHGTIGTVRAPIMLAAPALIGKLARYIAINGYSRRRLGCFET